MPVGQSDAKASMRAIRNARRARSGRCPYDLPALAFAFGCVIRDKDGARN